MRSQWMAPEAVASRVYSPKTDVWAFANTCVEILTQKDPFPGIDLLEVAAKVRDQGLHPTLPKDTPAWFADMLNQCWSLDADERPTMDDIIATMQSHMACEAESTEQE
jgi:serine/threonine protein kinase